MGPTSLEVEAGGRRLQSEGEVTTEEWSEKCNISGIEDGRRELQGKEGRQPLEGGKCKEADSPLQASEGTRPAKTLILALWDPFQTPDNKFVLF